MPALKSRARPWPAACDAGSPSECEWVPQGSSRTSWRPGTLKILSPLTLSTLHILIISGEKNQATTASATKHGKTTKNKRVHRNLANKSLPTPSHKGFHNELVGGQLVLCLFFWKPSPQEPSMAALKLFGWSCTILDFKKFSDCFYFLNHCFHYESL